MTGRLINGLAEKVFSEAMSVNISPTLSSGALPEPSQEKPNMSSSVPKSVDQPLITSIPAVPAAKSTVAFDELGGLFTGNE